MPLTPTQAPDPVVLHHDAQVRRDTEELRVLSHDALFHCDLLRTLVDELTRGLTEIQSHPLTAASLEGWTAAAGRLRTTSEKLCAGLDTIRRGRVDGRRHLGQLERRLLELRSATFDEIDTACGGPC